MHLSCIKVTQIIKAIKIAKLCMTQLKHSRRYDHHQTDHGSGRWIKVRTKKIDDISNGKISTQPINEINSFTQDYAKETIENN